jgi:hypothetical protein
MPTVMYCATQTDRTNSFRSSAPSLQALAKLDEELVEHGGDCIGVLAAQCLDRRIGSIERLTAETAAWEQQRNAARARIKWMFTTGKARAKMARAYLQPQANSGHIQRVKTSVQRY